MKAGITLSSVITSSNHNTILKYLDCREDENKVSEEKLNSDNKCLCSINIRLKLSRVSVQLGHPSFL